MLKQGFKVYGLWFVVSGYLLISLSAIMFRVHKKALKSLPCNQFNQQVQQTNHYPAIQPPPNTTSPR